MALYAFVYVLIIIIILWVLGRVRLVVVCSSAYQLPVPAYHELFQNEPLLHCTCIIMFQKPILKSQLCATHFTADHNIGDYNINEKKYISILITTKIIINSSDCCNLHAWIANQRY